METSMDPRHCLIPKYDIITDIVEDVYTAREVKKFIKGSKCKAYTQLERQIDVFLAKTETHYTRAVTVMIIVEALKSSGSLNDRFMIENLHYVVKSLLEIFIPDGDTNRIGLPEEISEMYDLIHRRDNVLLQEKLSYGKE